LAREKNEDAECKKSEQRKRTWF